MNTTPGRSLLAVVLGACCIAGSLIALGIFAQHRTLSGHNEIIGVSIVGGTGLTLTVVGVKRTWWPSREWVRVKKLQSELQ